MVSNRKLIVFTHTTSVTAGIAAQQHRLPQPAHCTQTLGSVARDTMSYDMARARTDCSTSRLNGST